MATTTTKRGASKKTKTSSKSASASKKTTVKKTTKKQADKKTTTAKTTTKSVNKTIQKPAKNADSTSKQHKVWNWALALLALGQAVALIVLGGKYLYSVTTSFITTDKLSGVQVGAQHVLFDLNILYVLAAALLVTALMHVLFATVLRKKYEAQILKSVNTARWAWFSATTSIVTLSVALIVGVTDISTMILILAACITASLLAMVRESQDKPRKVVKISSVLAALAPWIVIVVYLAGSVKYGDGNIENYVYYLVASTAVLMALLDATMYLNGKKSGRWADYTFTDRTYLLINFVLCSSLAWQVYFALLK